MTVDVNNESGEPADEASLARLGAYVLDCMRIHPQAELSVVLTDEATMTTRNERWMEGTGPTDVLAFPMDELKPGREDQERPQGHLGDVVLCPAVARRQAEQAGHPVADELDLLTVHGILHLLGYDHAETGEEQAMFELQRRLLAEWRLQRKADL